MGRKSEIQNAYKYLGKEATFYDGMHCEKCSGRVTEAVNDIPGAAGVVNLKKGVVTVSYEQDVPDEQIKARLQRHG